MFTYAYVYICIFFYEFIYEQINIAICRTMKFIPVFWTYLYSYICYLSWGEDRTFIIFDDFFRDFLEFIKHYFWIFKKTPGIKAYPSEISITVTYLCK